MAWLVSLETLLRRLRWVFCRFVLSLPAILGLRELGVLGLAREGIFARGLIGSTSAQIFPPQLDSTNFCVRFITATYCKAQVILFFSSLHKCEGMVLSVDIARYSSLPKVVR